MTARPAEAHGSASPGATAAASPGAPAAAPRGATVAPEGRPRVLGPVVDDQTRCVHYRTELDVVAMRFFCCGEYYPCHLCHAQAAGHAASQWPLDRRDERAVLCGVCGSELTIDEYLGAADCPRCEAPFNPGCALHTHLYFEL
ncbi:CHY zinc finger protein [Agromyces sp. NPDC058110]|uniref:CHY zinc finger protein n=1 Tax=Agromyces sp. NPDC058110 TaxID=3346345 RepID=UPI0036DEA927